MSEAKHSPRPWKVGSVQGWDAVLSGGGLVCTPSPEWGRPIKDANMHLISAAPELLAACEAFATAMRANDKPCLLSLLSVLADVDVAIAKAKGVTDHAV